MKQLSPSPGKVSRGDVEGSGETPHATSRLAALVWRREPAVWFWFWLRAEVTPRLAVAQDVENLVGPQCAIYLANVGRNGSMSGDQKKQSHTEWYFQFFRPTAGAFLLHDIYICLSLDFKSRPDPEGLFITLMTTAGSV
ncbi:hypothetical protein LAZ67_10003226 [Cordylochernes scorpioides]|uniref:Uncharacterized protein n=1 Tax=Cordylochernes scorpioides TaxID=51811 RepID=A0ABY6L0H7_9ARAC|nr:hypothetical protein LAZ67_10003226 [Cordylochernes scorpioides]